MEIKIDTQKDSKEEIKQVINLLRSVVGEENTYNEYDYSNKKEHFEENERLDKSTYDPPSEGLFNIFDSSEEVKDEKEDIDLELRRKESEEENLEKDSDKKNINIIPY